jgi:NhaP-type Na+/H+ or K+/H+ antiporter
MMATDSILTGLGLIVVLALGSQLIAGWTRLPAIVVLLPAGFIAGAVTDDVHPSTLFGATFQPTVSLGVGFILFEAGLRMRLEEMQGGAHRVVRRLIVVAVILTAVWVAVASELLFGIGWGSSVVLAAVLVVSGPTVVMPLLEFVRPPDRVRAALKWEGVLIDPLGALLGVLAFTAMKAGASGNKVLHPGEMLLSIIVGLQDILEQRTAQSAQALRDILGPIRMELVTPGIGRPFYRAVTSIDALALTEAPPGSAEGGSNSLQRWRRRELNPRPQSRKRWYLRA